MSKGLKQKAASSQNHGVYIWYAMVLFSVC